MRSATADTRGVSEALGVAVLIGVTVLITSMLAVGVLMISDQEQQQTADISFNHLTDQLAVVYEDEQPRQAGRLYIEGPENNVSWAELDDARNPEDNVESGSAVFIGPENMYGARVSETDVVRVIYFDDSGNRFVLATWNEGEATDPLDGDPGGGGGEPDSS